MPRSHSTLLTHRRSVSGEHPILEAIELIVSHCDPYSDPCVKTIRTARSFNSGEYLFLFSIFLSSHNFFPPTTPGRFRVWFLGGAGGPWRIKSPDNPDYIIGADLDGDGDLEVVGDFGAKGMWYFDYDSTGGKWTWMTSDSPTRFLAVDDDDDGAQEIHADFATKGLWRFDKTEKWKLLTSDNPNIGLRSDVYMTGWEESVWNFSTAPGTWLVYMSLSKPLWENLTGDRIYDDNASAELGIGDSSEELVCDFASKGLWGTSWESGNQTWTKITSWDPYDIRPVRFVGADDYELIIQFNSTDATGLYMWNCGGSFPGTLTQISTDSATYDEAFCEPFDPN
jgi:hypothetical protein